MDESADRFERRIAKAKKLIYPRRSAEDWGRGSHASSALVQDLLRSLPDDVARIDSREMSAEQFIEEWEAPCRPVVIVGQTAVWAAHERWTVARLLREYGSERFKVGEDDDGFAVFLKLKYYLRYLTTNTDDSPLYVFDSSFAERQGTRALRSDYELPAYFADDLFKLVGERRRPPYRWFVLGPARSGSYIHIDPLSTSAWNALLEGKKLWALFPPSVPRDVLQPKGCGGREAIAWWANVYPRLCEAEEPSHRPMTILQRAGETVFVPGGWWHCVLNAEASVAVTQNFCSRTNFDAVWVKTRKGRPKMSQRLVDQLRALEPALYERTLALADVSLPSKDSSSSSSSSSSDADSDSEDEKGPAAGRRERSASPRRRERGAAKREARRSSRSRSPRADQRERGEGRGEEEEGGWRDAARRKLEGDERGAGEGAGPQGGGKRPAGGDAGEPQPKRGPAPIAPLAATPDSGRGHGERSDATAGGEAGCGMAGGMVQQLCAPAAGFHACARGS